MKGTGLYQKVSDEKRKELIDLINDGVSIRQASKRAGVNYENAKTIYRAYSKEGRAFKKIYRLRLKAGETKEATLARKK